MGELDSRLAASAWGHGAEGPGDAVRAAVAGLGGASPALVLLFPDVEVEPDDALEQAHAEAPGVPVAGMSSDGVLTGAGACAAGSAAFALSEEFGIGVGLARDASADPRAAGRKAAEQALSGFEPQPGRVVLLLFLDPLSADEALAIDGAYSVAGGRIPLAGGGANGPARALLAGGFACRDAVVAVALQSPARVAVSVGDGCQRRDTPSIATRTDGRVLRELDGLPAENVYLEGLGWAGAALDDDMFEKLACLHPLGQSELRGQVRLRHVIGRDEHGGLVCATPVRANAAIWFTDQTPESIVDSAAMAAAEMVGLLGEPPRAALVFDCAARKRALGPSLDAEAAALSSVLGETPMAGLYTRGEVGRTRGAKGDRNHAIVVVGFA